MKIIILGAGQVGRTAAYHLAREEANDVNVVDTDEALLRDLQDRIDMRTVQGNAASPRTLETAGARDADMIVALTNSDETNMVACHVAWSLFGTKAKIARIRSRDYTKPPGLFVSTEYPEHPMALPGFAVDMYLSPEEAVTDYIERLIHSPVLNPELACGQCHTDTEYVVSRVTDIQTQVYNTKLATEDALIDSLNAIKLAATGTNVDAAKLDEARRMHREAQFMWDFVSAENSMGFHNPEYILKMLADSTNLARQAQMKATEAAGDPLLLQTGIYYTIDPPPTPFP